MEFHYVIHYSWNYFTNRKKRYKKLITQFNTIGLCLHGQDHKTKSTRRGKKNNK